jgi:RNA polymerase subunit RPABC4/transcription elongation factor Spt4
MEESLINELCLRHFLCIIQVKMFFFIGGVQPKTVRLDKQARLCPVCGHNEVYLKRVDHYLSLFFIPLFPVKKGSPFLSCHNCRTVFDERGAAVKDGRRERSRTCPYCGRVLEDDFDFCPRCGKRMFPDEQVASQTENNLCGIHDPSNAAE